MFLLTRILLLGFFCFLISCSSGTGSSARFDDSSEESLLPPTSLSIAVATTNVYIGLDRDVSLTVSPLGASTAVTWTVSDTNLAAISNDGEIVGLATGDVVVTVTSILAPSITATLSVSVQAARWVNHGDGP